MTTKIKINKIKRRPLNILYLYRSLVEYYSHYNNKDKKKKWKYFLVWKSSILWILILKYV